MVAMPAQARDAHVIFQYDPIELTSSEGTAAIYKRLRLTVKRACEVPSSIQKRQEFECRRALESDLVAEVRGSLLLARLRQQQR